MNQFMPHLVLAGVLFAIATGFLMFLVPWFILGIKKEVEKIRILLENQTKK